jgi:hypothetical protein
MVALSDVVRPSHKLMNSDFIDDDAYVESVVVTNWKEEGKEDRVEVKRGRKWGKKEGGEGRERKEEEKRKGKGGRETGRGRGGGGKGFEKCPPHGRSRSVPGRRGQFRPKR